MGNVFGVPDRRFYFVARNRASGLTTLIFVWVYPADRRLVLPTVTTAFDKMRQRGETRFLKEFPFSLSVCMYVCVHVVKVSLKAKAIVGFGANRASTSSLHLARISISAR